MYRTLGLFLQILFMMGSTLQAQVEESIIFHPTEKFSKGLVEKWIKAEAEKVNPYMKIELASSSEWSNYVNEHHYVPLTCEGVPEGYKFNYSWPHSLDKETRIKTVRLPSAEVTESGKFIFWWERCNFYELTENECQAYIHTAVTHEARHFIQWQTLANEAIEAISNSSMIPLEMSDLEKVPGAR